MSKPITIDKKHHQYPHPNQPNFHTHQPNHQISHQNPQYIPQQNPHQNHDNNVHNNHQHNPAAGSSGSHDLTKHILKHVAKEAIHHSVHHASPTTSAIKLTAKVIHKRRERRREAEHEQQNPSGSSAHKEADKSTARKIGSYLLKRQIKDTLMKNIVALSIGFLLFGNGVFQVGVVEAIEDHECFQKDTFDTCHTSEPQNGSKPDLLCVWCEYWCVHNAKDLQEGMACQEYSDEFDRVFDPPKITSVSPHVILPNTPTLINIEGQFFDMHTSTNVYNTVIKIEFQERRSRRIKNREESGSEESIQDPESITHSCEIQKKNFTHIRCVLEGIGDSSSEKVHIPLRFYFERVIYDTKDISDVSYDYTVKLVHTPNNPQIEVPNNDQPLLLGLTSHQILISSFVLGVLLACLGFFAYIKKPRIAMLKESFERRMFIRDMRKDLNRQGLLIELDSCRFKSRLGNGQFGQVFAAVVSTTHRRTSVCLAQNTPGTRRESRESIRSSKFQLINCEVAIKQLKSGDSDTQTIQTFVDEGIRMSKIHHPNILTPIGITFDTCQGDQQLQSDNYSKQDTDKNAEKNQEYSDYYANFDDIEEVDQNNNNKAYSLYTISEDNSGSCDPKPKPEVETKKDLKVLKKSGKKLPLQPSIVLPIMINGDLCRYLRSQKLLPIQSLVKFSKQIADGMSHLSSLKIVHGDLAARNCLLDENFTIKIADFGFTRRMYDCEEYSVLHRPSWPVRWMSPEQLAGVGRQRVKFTFPSDIWAYGVVMWEVFTLGSHPYDELNDDEIFTRLKAGFRLAPPVNCPDSVREVMQNCWSAQPDARPKFDQICERLGEIERTIKGSLPVSKRVHLTSTSSLPLPNKLASATLLSPLSVFALPVSSAASNTTTSGVSSSPTRTHSTGNLSHSPSGTSLDSYDSLSSDPESENGTVFANSEIIVSGRGAFEGVSNYTTLPDRCFANHDGRTLASVVSY